MNIEEQEPVTIKDINYGDIISWREAGRIEYGLVVGGDMRCYVLDLNTNRVVGDFSTIASMLSTYSSRVSKGQLHVIKGDCITLHIKNGK